MPILQHQQALKQAKEIRVLVQVNAPCAKEQANALLKAIRQGNHLAAAVAYVVIVTEPAGYGQVTIEHYAKHAMAIKNAKLATAPEIVPGVMAQVNKQCTPSKQETTSWSLRKAPTCFHFQTKVSRSYQNPFGKNSNGDIQ